MALLGDVIGGKLRRGFWRVEDPQNPKSLNNDLCGGHSKKAAARLRWLLCAGNHGCRTSPGIDGK